MAERQIHALERWHATDLGRHRLGGRHPGSHGTRHSASQSRPSREQDRVSAGRLPGHGPPAGTTTPPTQPNPIQDGTTILKIIDRAAGTVKLSKPLVASSTNCAFQFTRPVDDYASDAMIKLWYSWAQYYLAHWKDQTPSAPTGPTPITGSIEENTATMYFNRSASRAGRRHGGNRPRSGRRRDREGSSTRVML